MMFDCSELTGHLRKICDGTHRRSNGRFHTIDERREILSRYLKVRVEEIQIQESTGLLQVKSDVGTKLHDIIERDAGRIECGECRDEVTRLNLLPVSEVLSEIESIAMGIVERGKRKAPKFWQRWGATLAPGIAKLQAMSWVREACGMEDSE
jgi:hypothetical protein